MNPTQRADPAAEGAPAARAPSRTAQAAAWLRAAHQVLDATPRLLDDPVILPLLGEHAARRIGEDSARYRQPAASALRAHVALRSRYAEDRLAEAVGRGVGQYVLLGAGLDTFAWRQPAGAERLRIVEVDHPASQAFKRARLAAAGLALPENLLLVALDFERETLREGLERQGVARDVPTFFSWLGVTMYLAEAAIDGVLKAIAEWPPGSEVVLTFLQPGESGTAAAALAGRVAAAGEPFLSRFSTPQIEARLRHAGFSDIGWLEPAEAASRYAANRSLDLPLPRRTQIAWAIR